MRKLDEAEQTEDKTNEQVKKHTLQIWHESLIGDVKQLVTIKKQIPK